MSRLRVLYVSHSFPPEGRPLDNVGGMQRVATELHDALARHPQVELHGLLLRTSWRWTHARMPAFGARMLREIPRLVQAHGIDVVLFSSLVTAAMAAVTLERRVRAAGASLAAIVVGRDATLPFGPYQRWVPRVFRALDRVMPISRATEAECVARGLDPVRVRRIPCGVDTARLGPPADRGAARRALQARLGDAAAPLPADALLLCSVGRHMERKGFHWFVDGVMPLLSPRVHFWLAGEGPMTGAVRDAVERHGLAPRVRVLGRLDEADLALLLRGSDLFVMPNIPVPGDIEGFGVVMLEAGLAGLPVLAARLEGIEDVVVDGHTGHLVPAGDAAAFAGRIAGYLDHREELARLGVQAAAHVRAEFDWDAVAEQFVRELREVRGGNRG